jgi:hypothetical protein
VSRFHKINNILSATCNNFSLLTAGITIMAMKPMAATAAVAKPALMAEARA